MFKRLVLRNYVPLKDRNVNEIILDNIALFNIVLGRNGYGKSSILKQVNMLPPDNHDFYEGGYKEVEAFLNGKQYKVVSNTGKKSTHFFYVNGENINKGMTLSVQKELVKQHFGLTNDIKNILNGINRPDLFSALSPQRRKQLLMDINPNDTSLALMLFERIKREHTSIKGALKYQRQRLATELQRQKEIEETSPEELEMEISYLDKELKDTLIVHGTLSHIKDPDIESQCKAYHKLCLKLLEYDRSVTFTENYYRQMVDRTTFLIERETVYQQVLVSLINDIENKINDIVPDSHITPEEYDKKIAVLEKALVDIQHRISCCVSEIAESNFFHLDDISPDFIRIIDELILHLNQIELTNDDDITSTLFKTLLEKRHQVGIELNKHKSLLNNAQCKLKHYNDADLINCPNCDSQFKIGYGKYDIELLEITVEKEIKHVKQCETLLEQFNTRIECNEPWYYSMKTFMSFVSHSKCANYLLDIVKHFNVGRVNVFHLITLLKTIKYHNELLIEQKEISRDKELLNSQFKLMHQNDIKELYEKLESLTVNLGETQTSIIKLKEYLQGYEDKIDIIKADGLAREFAQEQYNVLIDMLVQKGMFTFKQRVEDRIKLLSPKKDALIVKLIKSRSFNNHLKDIADEVTALEKKESHLGYLVETLSPTKGFIGHLMFGFLNALCANVNEILEEVWTDPLRLLAPEIITEGMDGKIELDYKFRVVTTNIERPVPDIKECSGGEQEIIDFALRYVLLKYLGNFPLFMDEIGVAFDELHRQRFSYFIATQARLGKLPQTFMISHYISQYGAFDEESVNFISLNMDGLKKPRRSNQNVLIS